MMRRNVHDGSLLLILLVSGCAHAAPSAPPTTPEAQLSQSPPLASESPAVAPSMASTVATPAAEPPSPLVAIPGAAQPAPGLLTGGQPSHEQLQEAARQGYRTVISLRPLGEPGSEGEREQVEALGMRFVSIPVAGAPDLTEAHARALASALSAPGSKPAILHCGTGNRAGALLALEAFYVEGKTASEALELGKRAGLTKLEDAVRAQLEAQRSR